MSKAEEDVTHPNVKTLTVPETQALADRLLSRSLSQLFGLRRRCGATYAWRPGRSGPCSARSIVWPPSVMIELASFAT